MMLAAALCALALSLPAELRLRIASGAEWDTNSRRAVDSTRAVVGDGLVRLLADGDLQLRPAPGHLIDISEILGAKRFFRQDGEDLLAQDLLAASWHALPAQFEAQTFGRWRASHMRNRERDYDLAAAGGSLGYRPWSWLAARLLGRATLFRFAPDDHLSYSGPTVGAEIDVDVPHLVVSGIVEDSFNAYRSPARSLANGLAYLDGTQRQDTDLALILRAAWRGSFVLGGEAQARFQRSNSALDDLDRYRLAVFLTLPLFGTDTVLHVLGALQFNGVTASAEALAQAEDDENQNRLEVQFSQRFSDVGVDLRYSLYANEFATTHENFLRQTFYLGLSYALDSSSAPDVLAAPLVPLRSPLRP